MKHTFLAAIVLWAFAGRAQDPLFTQTVSAPQYLNPALPGTDTIARIDLAQRVQWPRLSGAYNTSFAGYQQYLRPLNGFAGVHYLYDVAGAITTQRLAIHYAQNIPIGKAFMIRPAIELGFFKTQIDWNRLTFGDMIDPRRGFIYNSGDIPQRNTASAADVSAGLLLYSRCLFLGVAVHHMTQPNESLTGGHSPLPMKFSLQLGADMKLLVNRSIEMRLRPYFHYTAQSTFTTWMAGANLLLDHVIVGGGFRRQDALLLNAGYQHRYFRLVYSYDMTTGELAGETGGSHEVSLSLFFWRQKSAAGYIPLELPY